MFVKTKEHLRSKIALWPYGVVSVLAAIAAFGTYTSMYAFRKAFAAATFHDLSYLHIDYKVWLVIAQVLGYTLSKFYGIRFISELKSEQRARNIFLLIGLSWVALLLFAIIPAPYNIVCLFLNGFPLGMIWGLVFSYLEGRKSTEFMAAVLSISLIFASGLIKTVGRILIGDWAVNTYWMPFITGALFIVPLVFFVGCLELMPVATAEDVALRSKRVPMNAEERAGFVSRFWPGILLTILIYVLLTVMRDVRDNFEVEIWAALGVKDNTIYTKIDSIISVIVLVLMSLLILVKRNITAFSLIHVMIIGGGILVCGATVMFNMQMISPMVWMTLAGLGLYLGYVPYNAVFFERMIATYRCKGNVGFLIYIADSMGYLASITLLLVKELGRPSVSWGMFFKEGVLWVGLIGGIAAIFSLLYFLSKADKPATITTQAVWADRPLL